MQVNAVKIKYLREQRCWSQLQLSEMAGISVRTLQRLEAKSAASQETIKSIAAVLEVECDKLLPESKHSTSAVDEQNASLLINEQTSTEKLSINSPCNNHQQEQEQDKLTKLRRKLFLALIIVIASNLFGFYGVFSAFDANKIDIETFHLLKDVISIALIFSTGLICFQAYRNGLFKKSDLF